jgi:hypothetical protein
MFSSINLAYYRKKDWKRLMAVIADREKMHDTWNEWHIAYLKTKNSLISEGFIVNDFEVDIDELQEYCSNRGIKNDGRARSAFVANR